MEGYKKALHSRNLTRQFKEQNNEKVLALNFIRTEVEKGTGFPLLELKKKYSEERLFIIGLKHITTTKKALCKALDIPVEAGCRYKRRLEESFLLMQSADTVICPYTKHLAHLISTNPNEFERLSKSKSNQINIFD